MFLGVVGAVALFVQVRGGYLPGRAQDFVPGEDLVSPAWTSLVALVVPAVPAAAMIVVPRRLGVALLGGWIGCGLTVVIFSTGFRGSLFASSLLALLIALVLPARTSTSQAERALAAEPLRASPRWASDGWVEVERSTVEARLPRAARSRAGRAELVDRS